MERLEQIPTAGTKEGNGRQRESTLCADHVLILGMVRLISLKL
jgi:hypothetical protein